MQMIRRMQYRCSFLEGIEDTKLSAAIETCRQQSLAGIEAGRLCNVSFYRYEQMGFIYLEEIVPDEAAQDHAQGGIRPEELFAALRPYLKRWPREEGDVCFAPMINVYYHHQPTGDLAAWEEARRQPGKQRIGRIAFVYPEKLPSYVRYHQAIVEEGLLMGDQYAYISLHENLLFSYFEEPRTNVNISGKAAESTVINDWLKADPESHFDREKAQGSNFLVIPCLFSEERIEVLEKEAACEKAQHPDEGE